MYRFITNANGYTWEVLSNAAGTVAEVAAINIYNLSVVLSEELMKGS